MDIDQVNQELQLLAQEAREQRIDAMYEELIWAQYRNLHEYAVECGYAKAA
jgi:hypothetical protein